MNFHLIDYRHFYWKNVSFLYQNRILVYKTLEKYIQCFINKLYTTIKEYAYISMYLKYLSLNFILINTLDVAEFRTHQITCFMWFFSVSFHFGGDIIKGFISAFLPHSVYKVFWTCNVLLQVHLEHVRERHCMDTQKHMYFLNKPYTFSQLKCILIL